MNIADVGAHIGGVITTLRTNAIRAVFTLSIFDGYLKSQTSIVMRLGFGGSLNLSINFISRFLSTFRFFPSRHISAIKLAPTS